MQKNRRPKNEVVYLTEACMMTDCVAAQLKLLQPNKLGVKYEYLNLFTQFSTLAKTYTTTAREPSIYKSYLESQNPEKTNNNPLINPKFP